MNTTGEVVDVRRILNAISGLCQEKGISKRGLAEAIGANYMAVWRALSEDVESGGESTIPSTCGGEAQNGVCAWHAS